MSVVEAVWRVALFAVRDTYGAKAEAVMAGVQGTVAVDVEKIGEADVDGAATLFVDQVTIGDQLTFIGQKCRDELIEFTQRYRPVW